jgi:hypothetical protein
MTFDLQKYRAYADALVNIVSTFDDDQDQRKIVTAARGLSAALTEIERQREEIEIMKIVSIGNDSVIARQRGDIDEQAKRIATLEGAAKADEGRLIAAAKKAGIEYFGCDTPDHLADRIAELIAKNNEILTASAFDMAFRGRKIMKQRAALKKLGKTKRERGKALVEERAKRLAADRGDCPYRSPIKNQLISRCDKGIICDWCQCPIKDEWRDEAREQLRHEGKL